MARKILALMALLTLSAAASATMAPFDLTFTYHWAPSALSDDDDHPLAPPAHYEVWLQRDEAAPFQVATVADDTTYVLQTEPGSTYSLRVCAVDSLGRCSEPSEWSDPLVIPRTVDAPEVTAATLSPAFPNPFNPSTTLRYAVPGDLPAAAPVRLRIHDARGALVRELAVDRSPGRHAAVWDGRDRHGRAAATGVYLAQFVCGSEREVTRLTLIK